HDPGAGRVHRRADRRPGGDDDPADAGRRDPGMATDREHTARHLCRARCRRAHPRWTDPPRRYRGDPRRDLAIRYARVHGTIGSSAAASADRAAQPLLRLPSAGDPRPWRRSPQIYGDGLLAIFTIASDESEVCQRALAAARQAQANVAELSRSAM